MCYRVLTDEWTVVFLTLYHWVRLVLNSCKKKIQRVIRSEATLGDLRDGKSRNCPTDLMVRVLQLAIVNPPHQSGVDGLWHLKMTTETGQWVRVSSDQYAFTGTCTASYSDILSIWAPWPVVVLHSFHTTVTYCQSGHLGQWWCCIVFTLQWHTVNLGTLASGGAA